MSPAKKPSLKVADVFQLDQTKATIVDPSTPFEAVIHRFAERPDLRGIFVVDDSDKLVGVITRQDLLNWAAGQLGESVGDGSWHDMVRIMNAATARDACRPRSEWCMVHPNDPLRDAFRLMLENELIDIPVVDEAGKILGDLRLSEILAHVLRHRGE